VELSAPYLLLLLIPALAAAVLAARGSRVGLSPWRARSALGLRVLLVAALVLILAGARGVLPNDQRAVVFVLDVSESIDPATRHRLLGWARESWSAHQEGDRAALVVFGREARVESPLGEAFQPGELDLDGLGRDRTEIGHALRVAGGLLGGETGEPRVVLLSDGNGDEEQAVREAMALASHGVAVTTVRVDLTPSPGEVLMEQVTAPPLVSTGDEFTLSVVVDARGGGPARLHFLRNGHLVETRDVTLAPGPNPFLIEQRLEESGIAIYEVTVEAEDDGDVGNNVGGAFVRVRGTPRALLAMGPVLGPDDAVQFSAAAVAEPLRVALEAAGFEVDVRGPGQLPLGLEGLAGYDVVLFGGLGAEAWTETQMEDLRSYVFDLGGGLVALGSPQSFGLGGYYQTPIEEALPVSSDVRDKKVLPSLSLVFCIDRSGSMTTTVGNASKLDLAKEGVVRSLSLLQPFDFLGVVAFDSDPEWTVDLTRLDHPGQLIPEIQGIEPGGGTALGPAIDEAHAALRGANTRLKHVVLLTDGQSPEPPGLFARLAEALQRDQITLSTVGVGQEIDERLLEDLARATGGRFLWARDARTIPRLLTKEAVTASRALLSEREFVPRQVVGELAPGVVLDWSSAPPLLGFVMTTAKPGAEVLLDTGPEHDGEDGPLLVRWRYGLGKSAAFTSDAVARWTAPWLRQEWEGYPVLMGTIARWVSRDPEPPGFETTLELAEGNGRVLVDVRDAQGQPIDGLELRGRVSGPPGADPIAPPALQQTGPGRYEAEFEVTRPGAYFVALEQRDADGDAYPAGSAGAVLAYPREYRDLTSNPALLERLGQVTRGDTLTIDHPPGLVFEGPREGRSSYQPLAPTLFVAAGVLLLLDVAARRLVLPEAARRWAGAWLRAPRAASHEASLLVARLRQQKQATREAAAARRAEASAQAVAREEPASLAEALAAARARQANRSPSAAPEPPAAAAPAPPAKPAAGATTPKPPTPPRPSPPAGAPAVEADTDASAMSKLLKAKRQARGRSGRNPGS
jgi:Ca-activated chloride channel homolog